MKAAILHGGGDLRMQTVPDPTPAPNEVMVRVHACSICGSDLHAFHGKHPRLVFPRILGHEFAGEIVDAGREVAGFRVGQRVCCDIDVSCGNCGPCRAGRFNICETLKTMGFDRDGAYAGYVAVPDYNLHPLPDNVTYDQAATVQVLGMGLPRGGASRAPASRREGSSDRRGSRRARRGAGRAVDGSRCHHPRPA